jgi:TP901 family phage tail tape measure protein
VADRKLSATFELIDQMSAKLEQIETRAAKLFQTLETGGTAADAALSGAEKTADGTATALGGTAQSGEKLEQALSQTNTATKALGKGFDESKEKARTFGEKEEEASAKTQKLGEKISGTAATIESVIASGVLLKFSKQIIEGLSSAVSASAAFESAITGVYKTVSGTPEQLAAISKEIKNMATELPSTAAEIAAVAEAAGQLGISTENVTKFSRVIMDLSESTNLGAENGASTLAKFANITKMNPDNYDKLGSTIVALGNNFATTELDITNMSLRLASAGKLANMNEPNILALSASLSSLGIESEAGGSALSRLITLMQTAVETGNKKLEQFADASGMSAEQFKLAFGTDAVGTMQRFFEGLNNGSSTATVILDEMGLTDIRLSNAIRSLAGNSELLGSAVEMANTAWEENSALSREASLRYGTLESKLAMTKNAAENLKSAFGDKLNPAIKDFADKGTGILNWMAGIVENNSGVAAAITGVGTGLAVASAALAGFVIVTKVAVPAIKNLNLALASNPILAPAAIIAGIVTATIALAAFFKVLETQDPMHGMTASTREQYGELQKLNGEYEEAKRIHGEYSTEAMELRKRVDDETEAFENNKQSVEEAVAKTDALVKASEDARTAFNETKYSIFLEEQNIEALMAKMARLVPLAKDNTEAQTELMAVIKAINAAMPEMGLNYDDLMGTHEAITKKVGALAAFRIENEKIKANQERYNELMAKSPGLKNDLAEKQKLLTDAKEALKIADAEYVRRVRGNDDNFWASLAGNQGNDWGLAGLNSSELSAAQKQVDDLKASYDDAGRTYQENLEDIEKILHEMSGMPEGTDKLTDSQQAMAAGTSMLKSSLADLALAYDETYKAAKESIGGQIGLFEKVEFSGETTIGTIKDALTTQASFFENYANRLQTLKDKGLSQELLERLSDGSVESGEQVKALAGASKSTIDEINKQYEKVLEGEDKLATETTKIKTQFDDVLTDAQTSAKNAINGLDIEGDAKKAAIKTMNGYIAGIQSKIGGVESAVELVSGVLGMGLNINPETPTTGLTLPGDANGTASALPGPTLVGEYGPEIVNFRGGEQVLTNGRTRDILAKPQGASAPVNTSAQHKEITLNINGGGSIKISGGMDEEQVWTFVQPRLRTAVMDLIAEEIVTDGDGSYIT